MVFHDKYWQYHTSDFSKNSEKLFNVKNIGAITPQILTKTISSYKNMTLDQKKIKPNGTNKTLFYPHTDRLISLLCTAIIPANVKVVSQNMK